MTVTVTTGLPVETDSVLSSGTRGLSGDVYQALAVDSSDEPYIYQDFERDPDIDDIYLEFDLYIPPVTIRSWHAGNKEALLFSLSNPDTDDVLVDLWVKRQSGRFVWYASTSLGGGDESFSTHMVAAGTHRVYVHADDTGATVTLPLDVLSVTV